MAMNLGGPSLRQLGGPMELIPDGTLAFGTIEIRPFNVDQGIIVTTSKNGSGNGYLDCEITITEGPYAGRKVWTNIGVRSGRPDEQKGRDYIMSGTAALQHIVEVGRNAHPTKNPDAYLLGVNLPDGDEGAYWEINGLRCAIRIGVEQSDGYKAKNKVVRFLSPNPGSETYKDYERLLKGDTAPPQTAAAPSQQAPAASVQASAPRGPQAGTKPSWLAGAGAPPPAAAPAAQTADPNKAPW